MGRGKTYAHLSGVAADAVVKGEDGGKFVVLDLQLAFEVPDLVPQRVVVHFHFVGRERPGGGTVSSVADTDVWWDAVGGEPGF